MSRLIPVVLAIDDNYVKQLSTVVVSILKNSNTKHQFEFNILSSSLSEKNQKIISSLKKFNKNTVFNFVDMKKVLEGFDLSKYMCVREDYHYISVETYFRFFIPQLFPQHKKVLYIDADILVMQDLKELFDTDISDFYAGVVQDTVLDTFLEDPSIKTHVEPVCDYPTYLKNKLGKKDNRYFNAGVLLMNLEKIRTDKVDEKLWQFVHDESPLEYQDQDVLNAVLDGQVKYLDYKWNTLKDLNWFATLIKDEEKKKALYQSYEKPGIFHYVGSNKPWLHHDGNYKYPFILDWWKYFQMTPYFSREDKKTLEKIRGIVFSERFKEICIFRICGFPLVDIAVTGTKLKIRILKFLRTHIKL